MRLQMLLQGRKQRKGATAHVARISVLTRVQALVAPKTGAVGEGAGAYRAAKRFLARMDASVGQQVRLGDERLVAGLALVRPLAGVDPLVRDECRAGRETLAAHRAHVRTFAGVDAHVLLEAARVDEVVEAHLALVAFHDGAVRAVGALVLHERRPVVEGSRADGALVGAFAGVRPPVGDQVRIRRERLQAHFAFVRFGGGGGVPLFVAEERRRRFEAFVAVRAPKSRIVGQPQQANLVDRFRLVFGVVT